MEPKDLKNSEELKSTENADLKKTKKAVKEKVEKDNSVKKEVEVENAQAEAAVESKNAEPEETEKTETATAVVVEMPVEEVKAEKAVDTKAEVSKEQETVAEKAEESVEQSKPKEKVAEKKTEVKAAVEQEKSDETEKEVEATEDAAEATQLEEAPVEAKKEEVPVEKVSEEKEVEVVVSKETEKVASKENTEESAESEEDDLETTEVKKSKLRKKDAVDYSNFSQVELVNALRDVLENNTEHDVKDEVENIKAVFYKIVKENNEKAKKEFLEKGGVEKEFKPEKDPYERDIKDLLKRYRQLRYEFSKKQEVEKEENLKLKYQVIEDIKGLINNEESINKTFNEFRELQHKWREIGLVPQSKMKNLWDTYHFHVENFYDYIKINRELRDLDLKKNLEIKIRLCERAEELLVEPSILKAFNTLQKYHERWREVGPVPREQKDDIWERFKAATSKINKKHQEFFESRKDEQKKNLEAKTALCEKVEEINLDEIQSYADWDAMSKKLVELQKVWRTIGFAPKKDNNKIYERFRLACDSFFNAKRDFYSKNKEQQQNNLQLKVDLCVQAESLKDSTDWKKTTQDFINIQKRWKEIGPIPRKHSDNVWKRFRAACDYFFDKKSEHFSSIDTEYVDNLKLKEDLIEEVINFKPAKDVEANLKSLKDFQRRWTEIGHVPFKKKEDVQNKFRDAINKLFDDLNINEERRNLLKFRSKMTTYSETNRGQNKMRMEREKYMNKLKQLENDLVLLDNNIGFFANTKNAESLIADVNKKIEMTKQKIELLKEKIRVIDEVDN